MASEPARGPAAAGLSHQATLWLSEAKAEVLFGKLGTHCHLAGAQLQLKDKFLNTRMGRKLVVFAASRQVAGNAIKAVLFQLSHDLHVAGGGGAGSGSLEPLEQSEWSYYPPAGSGEESEKQGPFQYRKMRKWLDCSQLPDTFTVQHRRTGMWVPLWYLGVASGQAEANGQADEEMVDCAPDALEQLVMEVQQHREGQDMSQLSAALPAFLDLAGPEGAEAMDYDVSGPDEEQLGGARVFVVVDTNILLSHLNFLERTMNDFAGAATQASHLGEPAVEVKLVVPYAVISELDGLKMRQEGDLKKRARHAINRLSELRSERDTWVLLQSVAEHHAVVESAPVKEGADDIILQTAVLYQSTYVVNEQRMRHASAAFLLSNDRNLLLKAQGAGVQGFTAQSFPSRPSQLEQAVRRMDQGGQANGHEGGMPQQQQGQQQQQQQQHVAHSPLASPQSSGPLPDLQQQIPGSPHSTAIATAAHPATHPTAQQAQQQQAQQQQEARMLQLAAQQQQVEQQQQEARMLQLAAQQQQVEQQQQRQQAQLAEQLRQLQMSAHGAQAPAHQQAAQQQEAQLAAAMRMRVLMEEHRSAWAVLEQAGAQQVEVMVHTIASRVGIEPQQLMLERELWLVGQAPLSEQLGQALALFQELAVRYQQRQAAALRQQQEQQQAAALRQQQEQQQQRQQQVVAALQQAAAVQQAALQQTLAGPTQQQQLQMLAALQARGCAAGEAGLAAAASPGGSPQQYQQLQQQLSLGAAQHSGELQQQLSLGVAQRSGELQLPQVHEAAALGRQQSGQQQSLVAGRQQAVARQGLAAAGPPDAAAQAALVLRRLQAAGMDLRGVLHQLCDIVAQGVAPIVIYHLQQELGVGWDSKGEYDDAPPAWDGAQTLSTLCIRANNFCWGRLNILQRGWIERDRKSGRLVEMERFLSRARSDRRPPPTHADLLAAAHDVLDLLRNFQATADMPHDDPPDPADITHFVSLGGAKAALQEGVRRCLALLAQLDPQGAPAP